MRHAIHVFWLRFKRASQALGNLVARILLTLFYFVAMAPFAAIARWRLDPLSMKGNRQSSWLPRPSVRDGLARARRQF